MMNRARGTRSRSRARDAAETRQPEEDGRRSSARQHGGHSNPPRTPRSTASSSQHAAAPATPHSAPPPSALPKTRCYRLNLERPFDIRTCASPLGRDYSGPPVRESDLPPAQGPVEYVPPPHLMGKDDPCCRRHSFGGYANSTLGSHGGATTPSEMMANLHVSASEESSDRTADPTTIAISTARIFRGIVVDRHGVITSMNSRATRSARGKGESAKNRVGEKSRQAAKIDKAKDLIDEVGENGGGGMSDEENDPTKMVSLFVMGEYEELNDLVRDGSKKLRDSKNLSDESVFMYNRPRSLPATGGPGGVQPMAGVSPAHHGGPGGVSGSPYGASVGGGYRPSNGAASPASASGSSGRKRTFGSTKRGERSYKGRTSSAAPKLKPHARDARSSSGRSGRSGYHRDASAASVAAQQQAGICGGGPLPKHRPAAHDAASHASRGSNKPAYLPQQCNFFPGNGTDWTEALGFSVNSLWNCGANGGHLSPTMTPHDPSSPRSQGAPPPSGAYRGNGAPPAGYAPNGGYHHPGHPPAGYGAGYYGAQPQQQQQYSEGRNPSSGGYGYGRGGGGAGVRDTVVM
ncbi:hypothetical protein ACHAXT_002614 [Thalassiosira profunda]